MFDFQDLEVYKKSKSFHIDCKKLCSKGKLDSFVRDQLSRASFSIPLNIAEGSGKFSRPDRKNYFITARASLFECVAILDILKEMHTLEEQEYNQLLMTSDEISRMLYSIIRNLQ